jgi:hypothetical protein
VETELRIQELLVECETRIGVEVRVYERGVLSSELVYLLPEEGIKVEVVGELVEECRTVEGLIVHFFEGLSEDGCPVALDSQRCF